jgi:hypothetical protein
VVRILRFAHLFVVLARPVTASSREYACRDPVTVGVKLPGNGVEVLPLGRGENRKAISHPVVSKPGKRSAPRAMVNVSEHGNCRK